VKGLLYGGKLTWGYTSIYEAPHFPEQIYRLLSTRDIRNHVVMGRNEADEIEEQKSYASFHEFSRLVFCIER